MKTVLKTVVTALAASVAAAASAGKAKTAFEAAAENKALVDRYAKSIATVRYYMKKDAEGVYAVNGQKTRTGILAGYDNGDVTLSLGGEEVTIPQNEVAAVRLHVNF